MNQNNRTHTNPNEIDPGERMFLAAITGKIPVKVVFNNGGEIPTCVITKLGRFTITVKSEEGEAVLYKSSLQQVMAPTTQLKKAVTELSE
jgi:hypothetical protein